MRVGELEDLLARLPDDMLICVSGGGGLRHVTLVDKQNRRRPSVWPRTGLVERFGADHLFPPLLRLEANSYRSPLWYEDEPGFVLRGRWPKARP